MHAMHQVFVPKFDIYDANGTKKYRLRPDTCVGGCCIMCRCGGEGGKCCRVPFIVRDPHTVSYILYLEGCSVSALLVLCSFKNY